MLSEEKIPRLRQDLAYEVVEEDSEKILILYDPLGYVDQPVAVPMQILAFLQMLDGTMTRAELSNLIREELNGEADLVIEPFFNLINYLDHLGFLESDRFEEIKVSVDSYLTSPVRKPVCSGSSYPSDPDELRKEIDSFMSTVDPSEVQPGARAVIVPHIDFRIGEGAHRAYASAYHAIRDTKADLYVIFGTAHYGSSDYFMLTDKDYETPLGLAETDKEVLGKMRNSMSYELNYDHMTHKHEHSVELQIVLLQHIFRNRNFRVLPVLVGSFHDFVTNRTLPDQSERFNEFIDKLGRAIKDSGRNPVFIASADMAHVGRKFGDEYDASPVLHELKSEDSDLIAHLIDCDPDAFFSEVSAVGDRNKICGLSPVYSMLKAYRPRRGSFLQYHQWDETETRSAVSFASLAYYD